MCVQTFTEEVDEEAAVAEAAGGAMEMEPAFRERDRISHTSHNAAGIRIGITEIEDDRRPAGTNSFGPAHKFKRYHVLEYEQHSQ